MEPRIINDNNTKIQRIELEVRPYLHNPYFVENEDGVEIGTAVLSFGRDGIKTEIFLDHHTPERLDFETSPNRLTVTLDMEVDPDYGLVGRVLVLRR